MALLEKYRREVAPAMMKNLGYGNVMRVPRLTKVVLNIGVGEAISNAKALELSQFVQDRIDEIIAAHKQSKH